MGKVIDEANYKDVLNGQAIFTCFFDIWFDKTQSMEDKLTLRKTQKAVMIGSKYLWIKNVVSQSISIL